MTHAWLSHAYVSLLDVYVPMTDLHCRFRLVHCPDAHCNPLPQDWPSGAVTSDGQLEEFPVHVSAGSQDPVLARHILPADASWQSWQQSSLLSSHTAPDLNLHVDASQHALSPQPPGPPQSHSSPGSTMPLPHC